jgi:hypothetical protein
VPNLGRTGGFRFFFYSNEGSEPPHVHVEKGSSTAKLWLTPVSVARSDGLAAKELNTLVRIVEERRTGFLKAWNDYFAS